MSYIAHQRVALREVALQRNPRHGNDDIHALCFGAIPLEAPGAVALVVPVCTAGAVHAAAAACGCAGRGRVVLDYGAVTDVLVGGDGGGLAFDLGAGGALNEGVEDGVLLAS